jgi:hypothetical protein
MGFSDGRNGTPIAAWQLLLHFARSGGEISDPFAEIATWPKVEKAVQRLRKLLKGHFHQPEDAIQTDGQGRHRGTYRTRFTVRLRPGYEE